MSVKVTDNTATIRASFTQKSSLFLRLMAEEIVHISTPKTPKKTGRLRMDVVKEVLGLSGKIKWGKNYAIYQETKQYTNYTTPGTGPHYAEDSVKIGVSRTSTIARRVGLA